MHTVSSHTFNSHNLKSGVSNHIPYPNPQQHVLNQTRSIFLSQEVYGLLYICIIYFYDYVYVYIYTCYIYIYTYIIDLNILSHIYIYIIAFKSFDRHAVEGEVELADVLAEAVGVQQAGPAPLYIYIYIYTGIYKHMRVSLSLSLSLSLYIYIYIYILAEAVCVQQAGPARRVFGQLQVCHHRCPILVYGQFSN